MPSEKSHGGIAGYFVVYAVLLVLLAATVIASDADMGRANLLVSLAIAICKAVLVVLFFMHVRASSHRVWVFSVAGFAWLAILLVLTMADYAQRPPVPDSGLTQIPLGVHDAERPQIAGIIDSHLAAFFALSEFGAGHTIKTDGA